MNESTKLKIERDFLLKTITAIENLTGKMFHEIHAETDMEIHELAYNNKNRLRFIRISLETEYNL